ncbi:DUF3034 family protein [Sphingobium boeckii]|uniref:DUF3034 family protein n=1 Tax=Sphingobium boeckii TaxID=1082345 RepID=A0A7W9AIZ9_9SPHN|nr:DUF3034 family protein [Sphingobium boeckii]MBB5686379.1 hypothetical protein [Sphingobium boeckii]
MAKTARLTLFAPLLAIIFPSLPAFAQGDYRSGGKLLLTGGVTSVEGASGGGLATWSTIAGDETERGIGASASATWIETRDFGMTAFGGKIGLFDRVELSYARQRFDTNAAGAALGLGAGFAFGQDVFGAKLRLFGDAVYDQDRFLPQVSIAVQHKHANRGAVIGAIGGRDDSGTDYVLSATKIILDKSLVLGGAARLTKANQFGLLGFGGDRQGAATVQFEGSAGVLVSHKLLVGAEYRSKPDNLSFAQEDDAYDLFAAYALHRHLTVTAAYVDLGDIATVKAQRGFFLSMQAGF